MFGCLFQLVEGWSVGRQIDGNSQSLLQPLLDHVVSSVHVVPANTSPTAKSKVTEDTLFTMNPGKAGGKGKFEKIIQSTKRIITESKERQRSCSQCKILLRYQVTKDKDKKYPLNFTEELDYRNFCG